MPSYTVNRTLGFGPIAVVNYAPWWGWPISPSIKVDCVFFWKKKTYFFWRNMVFLNIKRNTATRITKCFQKIREHISFSLKPTRGFFLQGFWCPEKRKIFKSVFFLGKTSFQKSFFHERKYRRLVKNRIFWSFFPKIPEIKHKKNTSPPLPKKVWLVTEAWVKKNTLCFLLFLEKKYGFCFF